MRYLIVLTILMFFASCEGKKMGVINPDVVYTCSMHPQIMQDQPGKCPICGMQLIALVKKTGNSADALMLSDQQIQLGNIQADTVGKGLIGDAMVLTATLSVDETRSETVSARIAGRIDRLFYKSQGVYVQKGAKLYDLYSEELNNAKQEYLLALEKKATLDSSIIDFRALVEAAKNKLLLWGMSEGQIRELEQTKKASTLTAFYSPVSGYIVALESHEGDYVSEGSAIIRVANLSRLWAEAQVYTSELSQVDPRGTATVRLPDLGKEIKGDIQFVTPEVDPAARINFIRVSIPNPAGELKPGMPVYVIVKNPRRNVVTLPADAVIRNEKMNLVWLQVGKNTFKSRMVETGLETGDRTEIIRGLSPGDVVVTRGAYLLNSEYIFKKGASPMAGMKM